MPVDLTFTLHFIVFLEFENRLYMKTPNKLCVHYDHKKYGNFNFTQSTNDEIN